ncbi:hypothetical protein BH09BAC5_BH09BAC5_22950 [soil metagenome]
MRKKSGMIYFYIALLVFSFGFLGILQFYPEMFNFSRENRGIIKIVIGSIGISLTYMLERERKKNKGI